MRILLALIFLFVTTLTASPQALWRNFFTINQNPIVDVVAGSNATVQASTPAVNIRRFTVNGVTDTNVLGLILTNTVNGMLSTNVPAWAQSSTNATYVTTAVLTNQTYASNVISGGQIVAGAVETNQLDNGYLQLTGDKRRTTFDLSYGTNYQGSNVVGVVPEAINAVNATNLYNANLPVPTNSPAAGKVITATSAVSSEWATPALGTGSSNITDAAYFAVARNLDIGTNLTTLVTSYSNTPYASLGTPSAGQYPVRYAADVVTSRGAGDLVKWNGASWTTTENCIATTDPIQFVLNAMAARLNVQTPICYIAVQTDFRHEYNTAGFFLYKRSGVYGPNITDYGAGLYAGDDPSYISGTFFKKLSTSTNACFAAVMVNLLSTDTDQYWVFYGIDDGDVATTFPTTASGFLYDRYNANAHGLTATNNWICMSANSSSYTFVDSGLPVGTDPNNPERLGVLLCSTNVLFYTNGVLAVNIAVNCPANNTYLVSNKLINNSQAGTVRQAKIWNMSVYRRQAAIAFP